MDQPEIKDGEVPSRHDLNEGSTLKWNAYPSVSQVWQRNWDHIHAFFPLSRRHSQGDLYDQQRGGTASLAAQDHQNAGCFSPRGVSAEVAISGDPPGMQEVDHASDQLEPSLELLHRPLARAHAQAGQVGIMHLSSFLRGDAREGEMPPSLATHPQKQPQPQKQSLVVYTEDWTQPRRARRATTQAAPTAEDRRCRCPPAMQSQGQHSHSSQGKVEKSAFPFYSRLYERSSMSLSASKTRKPVADVPASLEVLEAACTLTHSLGLLRVGDGN